MWHVTYTMKKNKKKDEFIDDGRTIANMDVEGLPHRYDPNRKREYDVTKEEKRQLIGASYKAMLPMLLCGLIGMGLAMLLIMLWLHII